MGNDLYDAGGSVIHLLNYWGQIIMSACYDEHEVGQLALFSSNPCEIVILVNFLLDEIQPQSARSARSARLLEDFLVLKPRVVNSIHLLKGLK